ncbi:MAG: hypothetical protein OYL97_01205 [Candidatus Poribacteria bacterium]|nr:hypothetical protein [Candidatus Poribacteria bacterium]
MKRHLTYIMFGTILLLAHFVFAVDLYVYASDVPYIVKCQRLFRPKFSKVKPSFVFEIPQVSDTLTPNAGVCGDTLV